MSHNSPLDALRYHVTGAIERGEATAIRAKGTTMDKFLTMTDIRCNPALALAAIIARIQGDWDNPTLIAVGPLSTDEIGDVLYIATECAQNFPVVTE